MVGAAFGLGLFTPGLWWMGEFHVLGAALVVVVKAALLAAAMLLVPPRWGWLALPGALVLAEAARRAVPFGGVPMAGLALGQVGGPLSGAARVGGELLVLGLTAAAGVGVAGLARRRWTPAAVALGLAVVGAVAGAVGPDGGGGRLVETALVQGGGRRGFRAVESDPEVAFQAQLAASQRLTPPLELVLWPEDVIDVDGSVAASPKAEDVADLARRSRASVVAGVTEEVGLDHFVNAAVAWSPEGRIVARYNKVKRVPFGEYVPVRAFFDRLADLSAVPRDALPGRGSGLMPTPAGDLGVTISYEVFFSSRGRAATRAGAEMLAVPTNAASYSGSQVPAQEVAAARLRAIECGRELVQAAPTGYSAHIDHRGRVLARTSLGRREVIQRPVEARSGRTVYVAVGDAPVVAVAGAALAGAWLGRRRSAAVRTA